MKLAVVILAHTHPPHLERLVRRLRPAVDEVVIHINAVAEDMYQESRRRLADDDHVHFTDERHRVRWGQYSIVEASLAGLRHLRTLGRFDRVLLMSGQDYPVRPLAEIRTFFEQHPQQQFMEMFRLDQPNWFETQGGPYAPMRRIRNWHIFYRSRIHLDIPVPRRLPAGLLPHGGSFWWSLTGDCVDHVLDTLDRHPKIERYFRHTFLADETFYQTIIGSSPFAATVDNDFRRYVDWTNPNPTPPRVLEMEDFDKVVASTALFARKMDPVRSADLLARIDRERLQVIDLDDPGPATGAAGGVTPRSPGAIPAAPALPDGERGAGPRSSVTASG